jgi:hypothetical protein
MTEIPAAAMTSTISAPMVIPSESRVDLMKPRVSFTS